MRRARLLRFPSYRLTTEQGLEVGLARYSALNIYFFGPGQKIALPWGGQWRLTAVARGSGLAAVVANEDRQRLAMAAPGAVAGNYGINGRDYAYTLNPAEGGFGRARLWDLFAGEERVARFTRRPFGGGLPRGRPPARGAARACCWSASASPARTNCACPA